MFLSATIITTRTRARTTSIRRTRPTTTTAPTTRPTRKITIHTTGAKGSLPFSTNVRHSSRLGFLRSTGNGVSGHYFCHYLLSFFPFFSPSSSFLIEGVLIIVLIIIDMISSFQSKTFYWKVNESESRRLLTDMVTFYWFLALILGLYQRSLRCQVSDNE